MARAGNDPCNTGSPSYRTLALHRLQACPKAMNQKFWSQLQPWPTHRHPWRQCIHWQLQVHHLISDEISDIQQALQEVDSVNSKELHNLSCDQGYSNSCVRISVTAVLRSITHWSNFLYWTWRAESQSNGVATGLDFWAAAMDTTCWDHSASQLRLL